MPKILDDCVPVHCRKCGQYLATIIPRAEVLCPHCSTALREVWTAAKSPPSQKREAIRKRAYRERIAAQLTPQRVPSLE